MVADFRNKSVLWLCLIILGAANAGPEGRSLSLSLSTHSYDIYSMIRGYATLKFVFLWRWVQVPMLNNALETDVHRNNLNGN